MSYLEAALAAGAEVRASDEWRERALKAEAQLAVGGANASIAKETHTSAGAQPVLVPVPLAELSREVFSFSNKIQQPVELTVQLLVLSELRALRYCSGGV